MRKFNKDYSLVRFLHAVPDAEEVDIYVNGSSFYNGLDFTNFTPYVYMPKGVYTVEVFAKDSKENPLLQQEVKVDEEELLTVAIIIDEEELSLLPIKEDMEISDTDNSKVRFVHLVLDGRDANVIMDGEEVFSDVEYTDVTEYILLPPKLYNVAIEAVDNNQIIRRLRLNINSNRIYTFYAIGKAPNFQIYQSLDGGTFMN